jgi:hypothetical protein
MMSVYTVHEPPLRAAEKSADPQRFVFVRDGFYFWAFVLTPLWMIWRRLWMVLALYLVLTIGLEMALHILGAPRLVIALAGILISLLIGLEAGTLRRFTLRRRRWQNVGIVSGRGVEDAERRFFDTWLRDAPARNVATSMAPASPSAPMSGVTETPGVIGLFPEPGAQR